jgi:Tol biopolymer transport system component
LHLNGISPDGRRIFYVDATGLLCFAVDGRRPPERVTGPGNAALSPDATWVVYSSGAESGIYAQSVSGASLPRQIADKGSYPVWHPDGKEILYSDRGNIWSVQVEGSSLALRFAKPELLFSDPSSESFHSGSMDPEYRRHIRHYRPSYV